MRVFIFALAFAAALVASSPVCPYDESPNVNNVADCQGLECLQNYVEKEDGMFSWVDTGIRWNGTNGALDPRELKTWQGYVLNVTSQKWLEPEDFDFSSFGGRPVGHIWWHMVAVIIPGNLRSLEQGADKGFLWITGGNNNGGMPSPDSQDTLVTADVAMATGTIGAAVLQIPNQPVAFAEDPEGRRRSEDATIAWTWAQFARDPSKTEWPLRLPMTKGAVKCMDAVQEFTLQLSQTNPSITPLKEWSVAGASKRGWTAWTVAAVDSRVIAMLPLVSDILNFVDNIKHHFAAYGGWAFALEDYTEAGYVDCLDHPNTKLLMDIVDPYAYKERYTMPIFVISSAMDEFFLPDDTHYWWDDMPGEKHFLMAPNTEHALITGIGQILPAVGTYINAIVDNARRPDFKWEISPETGDITVEFGPSPPGFELSEVTVWSAVSCNDERRDFRIVNLGWGPELECNQCGFIVEGYCANLEVLWSDEPLEPTTPGGNVYVASKELAPDGKWTAFFVDAVWAPTEEYTQQQMKAWPFLAPGHFDFTTEVSIWPNTFPYEECYGAECGQGILL